MTETEQLLAAFLEMRKSFVELNESMKTPAPAPEKKQSPYEIALKLFYYVGIPLIVTLSANNVSNANRDNRITANDRAIGKNELLIKAKVDQADYDKDWKNHIEKQNYNFETIQTAHQGMYLLIEK